MSTATAEPAPHEALDTAIRLVTPERIAFRYPLAGPFRRATAFLVDLVVLAILTVAILVLSLAAALGTPSGLGLGLALLFALRFGYGALFEGLLNGQTPGKRALGIRVVSVEGVPITGGQAFLRNLLWAFDGLVPFAYMPALASMMLTSRFQRLGDLAAGTMVVVEARPGRAALPKLDPSDREAIDAALSALPGRIDAGPALSRALADYVKGRRRFLPARREEMARPLARPARLKYDLAEHLPGDAILCALYHRVFLEG